MERLNTNLIIALCVIILSLVAVNDSWGQAVTEEDIYRALANPANNGIYTVPNNTEFAGNIQFPPEFDDGWQDPPDRLDDIVYTISFAAGITATFQGSLTITVNESDDAIGRIQALGERGNMVTLDAAGQNWGGITIRTDPRTDLEGQWRNRMLSGNYIGFVHALGVQGTSIICGLEGDNAQVFVEGCLLESVNALGFAAFWGGVYWFQGNVIVDGNGGIWCQNSPSEDDPGYLNEVLRNNRIVGAFEPAIWVEEGANGWSGTIANNIIEATENARGVSGVLNWFSPDAIIRNNLIVGYSTEGGAGIALNGGDQEPWWCDIRNNTVVDCWSGMRGLGDAEGEVHYSTFNDIGQGGSFAGGADEGDGCLVGSDLKFVDFEGGDYHLIWNPKGQQDTGISKAIDTGDPEILDPEGSRSDIGAFGGPFANRFATHEGDYDDYIWVPETQTFNPPEPPADPIEVLRFHEFYRINGSLEVGGADWDLQIAPGSVFEFINGDFFVANVGNNILGNNEGILIGDLEGDPEQISFVCARFI